MHHRFTRTSISLDTPNLPAISSPATLRGFPITSEIMLFSGCLTRQRQVWLGQAASASSLCCQLLWLKSPDLTDSLEASTSRGYLMTTRSSTFYHRAFSSSIAMSQASPGYQLSNNLESILDCSPRFDRLGDWNNDNFFNFWGFFKFTKTLPG